MPSTQWALEHCEFEVQLAPLPLSGWQVLSLVRQKAFAAHCVSLVQLLPQAVMLAHT